MRVAFKFYSFFPFGKENKKIEVADWWSCYLYKRVRDPQKKRGVPEEVLHTQTARRNNCAGKKQASER